jgi:branched-chain amino acid transport system permease protein
MAVKDAVWLATVAALAVAAIVYPLGIDPYAVATIRDALLFGLFALSLDLFWGKTGMLSFGHATFFGLGTYAMAVVTIKLGLGPSAVSLLGLIIGMFAAGGIALIVGYFLIFGGVRGAYFTVVTLAMTIVAQQIAIGWSTVTGGDAGLIGVPPFTVGHYEFADLPFYYLILSICVLALLGAWVICRGRYGRVLAAVQDHELRAQTLGYHTSLHLLIIFVISAMLAALAGGLYATATGFVAPDMIGLLLSTEVIVWVAVGGRGTLVGSFIGTFIVTQAQDQVSSIDTRLWPLAMGAFFIAMVFLFPDGLIGLLEPLRRLVARRGSSGAA